MKTGQKLLTGSLLALCAALLVLCIVLAAGWGKAAKTNTALPEVRNNGTAIQWKYSDEVDWHDLVALDELKGAAGAYDVKLRDIGRGKSNSDRVLLRLIPQKGANQYEKSNHKNQAADSLAYAVYGAVACADVGICGRFDSQH